jgi:type IV secretory pathway ATPase VirB11/archaellum biosynthesis ATPase
MKKEVYGVVTVSKNGMRVYEVGSNVDITDMFRDDMIALAAQNLEALKFNPESGRAKRIPMSEVPGDSVVVATDVPNAVNDPVLALINKSHEIKPADLEMSDTKWKYLVRSALRGKNIMAVGPAGCGKTQSAKALANIPVVKEIEVTEEEYEALLSNPNIISVTKL